MIILQPGGHMNYQADASSMVGNIYGPGLDGVYHLAVKAELNGRRIGFYALDTPEAQELAKQWLAEQEGANNA